MNDNYKYKYMKYKKMYLELKNQSGGFEEIEDFNNSIYSESEYMGGFKRNHQQTGGMEGVNVSNGEERANQLNKENALKQLIEAKNKENYAKNKETYIKRNFERITKHIDVLKNCFEHEENKNFLINKEKSVAKSEDIKKKKSVAKYEDIEKVQIYFENDTNVEYVKSKLGSRNDFKKLFEPFSRILSVNSKFSVELLNNYNKNILPILEKIIPKGDRDDINSINKVIEKIQGAKAPFALEVFEITFDLLNKQPEPVNDIIRNELELLFTTYLSKFDTPSSSDVKASDEKNTLLEHVNKFLLNDYETQYLKDLIGELETIHKIYFSEEYKKFLRSDALLKTELRKNAAINANNIFKANIIKNKNM